MDWHLTVENDLIAAVPRIVVTNQEGARAFVCSRTVGLLHPGWVIAHNGDELLRMTSMLGLRAKWHVEGALGEFEIRQRPFSIQMTFDVVSGHFEGATLTASVVGREFDMEWRGVVVAKGTGPAISMRDRHEVELVSGGAEMELLTVACIVALHDATMHKAAEDE